MLARSSEAIAVNLDCRAVHNVRFWHKADIPDQLSAMSAFGGKADIAETCITPAAFRDRAGGGKNHAPAR
jgi:hypothetical protein